MGDDFERAAVRVAEVMGMSAEQVTAFGKSPPTVRAQSLLCFWAQRKPGMSTIAIAAKLKLSQPAVSRSSKRGERIERQTQVAFVAQNRIKL